jgi:hypothetical protein
VNKSEVGAAWKYVVEELDRSPENIIIAPTITTRDSRQGDAMEIVDLRNDWHSVKLIGRTAIFSDEKKNLRNLKINSSWPGHPDDEYDEHPMGEESTEILSAFNPHANDSYSVPREAVVTSAIKVVDPHLVNENGSYRAGDSEGVAQLGQQMLSNIGYGALSDNDVNLIRSVGMVGMETLNNYVLREDQYRFRPAENEKEEQDEYVIPGTEDFETGPYVAEQIED